MTYEEAEKELLQIVERLERGDASLDEALKLWERGEELYRFCAAQLERPRGRSRSSRSESTRRARPDKLSRAMAAPLDLLRKIDLFEELSDRDLERLASSFKESQFSAGDTIATEGERGVGFFVIARGDGRATASAATRRAPAAPATTSARSR